MQENRLLRRPGEQAPACRLVCYLEFGAVQGIPDVANHDLRTCWVRHAGNRSTGYGASAGASGSVTRFSRVADTSLRRATIR